MKERQGEVTMKGKPLALTGTEIRAGQKAPAFTALNTDLSEWRYPDECAGSVCVIVAVPSLDTSVCNVEARRFDSEAASLGPDAEVIVISADLPFAQKRWRDEAGVGDIRTVSDHLRCEFAKAYGVLIKDLRLLARSVFVVDREGTVRYRELVREQGEEPDYDRAIEEARKLL